MFKRSLILLFIISLAIPGVIFAENGIEVVVDDEVIEFPDQQPYIDESSRTQVPVRFISEALDANLKVDRF